MTDEAPIGQVDAIERAICAETCAFMGEPPCWRVSPEAWPNPECDEPGCRALAVVAVIAARKHDAEVERRIADEDAREELAANGAFGVGQ